jgi:diamine N-acetyltransferase
MYGPDEEFDIPCAIIRLMIAADQQGKGYGRAAMQAVIRRLKDQPECGAIYTSIVPENTIALQLYRSLGFEPTGEIFDGEIVLRLEVAG